VVLYECYAFASVVCDDDDNGTRFLSDVSTRCSKRKHKAKIAEDFVENTQYYTSNMIQVFSY